MERPIEPVLFVVGVGLMIPAHITAQATRAMLRCDELYCIVQEPPRTWLPEEGLRRIKIIDAQKLYVEGRLRMDNYDHVTQTIKKALTPGRTVGYLTYGNPMAFDRVAQDLVAHAKQSGLPVKIVPGISTVDALLCDLGVDMAPAIQVFDASWFFACGIEPIIQVPMLLVQVGCFGSLRTHYSKRQDGKSLAELVAYLCKFYPPAHPTILVRSTGEEERPEQIRRIDLEYLCDVRAEELSGASLYIPASTKPQLNEDFVNRMERT